jgi:hypothetical protein
VVVKSAGTTNGGDLTFPTATAQASEPLAPAAPILLGNGSFHFAFTNTPGARFTVLYATNMGLPLSNWIWLNNVVVESPAGQFRFTDPQATTNGKRFYRVRSP